MHLLPSCGGAAASLRADMDVTFTESHYLYLDQMPGHVRECIARAQALRDCRGAIVLKTSLQLMCSINQQKVPAELEAFARHRLGRQRL